MEEIIDCLFDIYSKESAAFSLRPKRTGVKRRDRRERPERLLFERSEFQTRQRAKGTK